MLTGWGRLFFEANLLGTRSAEARAALNGDARLRGLRNDAVFPSYSTASDQWIDRFESNPGFSVFEMGGVATTTGFTVGMEERSFFFSIANQTYDHRTTGAFGAWAQPSSFTHSFAPTRNVAAFRNLSFRVARGTEFNPTFPPSGDLGITIAASDGSVLRTVPVSVVSTGTGITSIVPGTGGLPGRRVPIPYTIPASGGLQYNRTVLRTVRVPFRCIAPPGTAFNFTSLVSVQVTPTLVPLNAAEPQHLIVDDLAFTN